MTPIPSREVKPETPACGVFAVEPLPCPVFVLVEVFEVPEPVPVPGVGLVLPPTPSRPVISPTVSLSCPGSGTPGTPVTVGRGDSKLLRRGSTTGMLGSGVGEDRMFVTGERSGVGIKLFTGSSSPAEAEDGAIIDEKVSSEARTANAATPGRIRILFTDGMFDGSARSLYG
jgi:hypothetical protein